MLPAGYTIGYPIQVPPDPSERRRIRRRSAGGHAFVLDPAGQPVRDELGIPIRVCCSPNRASARSDRRKIRALAAKLSD